ncbi:hypothetical protein [Algoriphagus persicinus]|nr:MULTISPECIES: hypothetical protein [unclassified Algoriphagus]MEB2780780.1 hypothetical protein [Algoriphagus sp. C2-6-M1]MEB2786532.1 hypothetical protein [Algoriphagus sp. E1-3-M2]
MKSSMTKVSHRGMIIRNARFSRINPDSYRDGTCYVAIEKQNINT